MQRIRGVPARLAVAAAMLALTQVAIAGAEAQAPSHVTGLTAVQEDGFTRLAWTPVLGATDYQIERTPVDASNTPTGAETVVGVWQPQRTITPERPTFADSGFALGERFRWRVRASIGTEAQPYSEPVFGTTLPQWGTGPGASLRSGYELSGDGTYTSDVDEYAYEHALDEASDRVRLVEIGRTVLGRPINMFVIGYPAPPTTAAGVSDAPTYAINCNVHGNEPSGREACLIMARELAFTDDPHLVDILKRITVLMVVTINGDGRAANTRGNSTGQDLNRDYAEISQPETKGFVAMLRDYTPEVLIDEHEGDNEDLPILTARHLNVHEPLFSEGKNEMVERWMYGAGAEDGWWLGPYSNGGDSHEGILRNTGGLKNMVSMLGEARASGGVTRPAEGTTLANHNRKVYGHLWENFEGLDYYAARRQIIHRLIERAIEFNVSNTGPVVTRGAYPWPYFPANGANTALPNVDALTPDHLIDPAPCGYFLTDEQYLGDREGGSVALRLRLHGIAVQRAPGFIGGGRGYLVPMTQPQRGLIPPLLDEAAVDPEPIIVAQRLFQNGGRCGG
jgi:Zinc carboxypeptidase